VALESMQKATIAPAAASATWAWSSTPPASGAASSRPFLLHWRGRQARDSARAPCGLVVATGGLSGSERVACAAALTLTSIVLIRTLRPTTRVLANATKRAA